MKIAVSAAISIAVRSMFMAQALSRIPRTYVIAAACPRKHALGVAKVNSE
jgi:hypothetical protein